MRWSEAFRTVQLELLERAVVLGEGVGQKGGAQRGDVVVCEHVGAL